MKNFLEPIFLNEKMLLNIAVYLFKGITLKEEIENKNIKENNIKGSIGLEFLKMLINPISINGEHNNTKEEYSKSARIYTLGGLHMSVVDKLEKDSYLKYSKFNFKDLPEANSFVKLNVILKPLDYYQILDALKLLLPIVIQFLEDFPNKKNNDDKNGNSEVENDFQDNPLYEIPKYKELIMSIIKSLEDDYFNSKQLEMFMIDPKTKKIIGLVDIDLTDKNPQEIKAKLNDGQFIVIGKVSRIIEKNEKINLFQRTLLSKIFETIENLIDMDDDKTNILQYRESIKNLQPIIEKVIKINLRGSAIRVIALSINV